MGSQQCHTCEAALQVVLWGRVGAPLALMAMLPGCGSLCRKLCCSTCTATFAMYYHSHSVHTRRMQPFVPSAA